MSAECRSCRAPIQWAMTAQSRRIPLDQTEVDPESRGAQVLFMDRGGILQARPLEQAAEEVARQHAWSISRARHEILTGAVGSVHASHFATCPNSKQHRKSR